MKIHDKIGNVRVDQLLGRGGMGEVYQGFDERLERWVALKAIRPEKRLSEAARARFVREARILSRLQHPGICQVYDLVESGDEDILVMELVEGRTLSELELESLNPEEKLEIALGVTEVLAVAHAHRIVHRDLKPDNVMLTPEGVVKVLDFGIARSVLPGAESGLEVELAETVELAGTRAPDGTLSLGRDGRTIEAPGDVTGFRTEAGSLIGTLSYMSPEQARGETVTEASDLYSLGILLQELFTGRPSYEPGSLVRQLERVRDGETVPIEGLEEELTNLIGDLQRLLPASRPTAEGALARLRGIRDAPARRRQRRVVVAGSTVLGLVLLGATGLVVHARWEAVRRAEIARDFAQQAEDIAWSMRAEHLSPAHDIRPARSDVRGRLDSLAAKMSELGDLALGPGHSAMGRAELALGELDRAREHLELAWSIGYRPPRTALALGEALGRIYERELTRVRRVLPFDLADLEKRRLDRELRAPALEALRQARDAGAGETAYVDALVLFLEEDRERALARLAEAEHRPWFYETSVLEGRIHFAATLEATHGIDFEAVRRVLNRADRSFQAAAEIGPSDPTVRLLLCESARSRIQLGEAVRNEAASPEAYQSARTLCEATLRIDPGEARARCELGALTVFQARRAPADARDATFQEAIAEIEHGLEGDPAELRCLSQRSEAYAEWGKTVLFSGGDAAPIADRAIDYLRELLRLRPRDLSARRQMSELLDVRGWAAVVAGEDPTPWATEGMALSRELLEEIDSKLVRASLGRQLLMVGRWRWQHGDRPGALTSLREAVDHMEEAARGGDHPLIAADAVLVLSDVARLLVDFGQSPESVVEEAREAARRLLEGSAADPRVLFARGLAKVALAEWTWAAGGDGGSPLEAAMADYREGLERQPENFEARVELAGFHLLGARAALRSGRSPAADLRVVREVLAESERRYPGLDLARALAAEADLLEARGASSGERPRAWEQAWTSSLELAGDQSASAAAHRLLAEVGLFGASEAFSEASGRVDRALEAARRSLEIDGDSPLGLGLELGLELRLADRAGDDATAAGLRSRLEELFENHPAVRWRLDPALAGAVLSGR